jgi:hypothetical protein
MAQLIRNFSILDFVLKWINVQAAILSEFMRELSVRPCNLKDNLPSLSSFMLRYTFGISHGRQMYVLIL